MYKATYFAAALSLALFQSPAVATADEITILAGDLPPMFNADGSGREAEIISTVMERCGHTVSFEIQPFTRHWKTYASGTGDAVATVPVGMPLGGHQSDVYIQYQNGVSFLTDAGNTYGDLAALADRVERGPPHWRGDAEEEREALSEAEAEGERSEHGADAVDPGEEGAGLPAEVSPTDRGRII